MADTKMLSLSMDLDEAKFNESRISPVGLGGHCSSSSHQLHSSPTLRASTSEVHTMHLLSVPGMGTPLGSSSCSSDSSSKHRRLSFNTPPKNQSSGANSPNLRRRSSLAAVKWSVLARRFSINFSHDRDLAEDPTKAVGEVNCLTANFRETLLHIGQTRDGPEMREKIRRLRRQSIDSCKHAVMLLLQQIRSDVAEGIPVDYSPQLVLLFFCTQLLLRELLKCRRLVVTLPIDMSSHYAENRTASGFGTVLSQIILCRQLNPDFNEEELCSIDKDTQEIFNMLDEMQEFMPKPNTQTLALAGEDVFSKWARRRRKKSFHRNLHYLCCVSKSRRLTN